MFTDGWLATVDHNALFSCNWSSLMVFMVKLILVFAMKRQLVSP